MSNVKILIVEDHAFAAISLQETLERQDFKVVGIARSFNEALVAVIRNKPDLVLMDIDLGDSPEDGILAAQEIKKNFDLPVIYLTGKDDEDTFKRASETYPEDYIIKPFKHSELIFKINLAYNRYLINKPIQVEKDGFFVYANRSHIKIKPDDLIFMEADRVFTNLYCKNLTAPLLVTMNIGYISKHFGAENFYKISQSLLINLDYLQRIKENELFFEGVSKTLIISESKKAELKKRIIILTSPRSGK